MLWTGLRTIGGLALLVALIVLTQNKASFQPTGVSTSTNKRMHTMKHYNHLGEEKSPYLLQHKDNPVHWFAWGKTAFAAARAENKPIFLSIGYSTCHWCHVMEHDSFERDDVAQIMNDYFINIKVDREELPAVDQLYMDAVVGMIGHGGWPLSVFLTPDLKPFFGGTFWWRAQFLQVLEQVHQSWENEPERIDNAGQQVAAMLQSRATAHDKSPLSVETLRNAHMLFLEGFDQRYGGFGDAPKFPRSTDLALLLRIYHRTGDKRALEMVTTTLDAMARGGMYDHLGGGFHRYATDPQWLVPHFEKMLYDNALLAVIYLEAYQVTHHQMYADVARQVLDYVLRDMTGPTGGFYSAEDADSEGEEGKYYVWSEAELRTVLTADELRAVTEFYGVTPAGNFEHQANILYLPETSDWRAQHDPLMQAAHEKLFRVREARIHPSKDDKILTAWNGLMIAAMAKGYQVLGDRRYLQAAQKSARFLREQLVENGELLRRHREGQSRFEGTLNDYAYLIQGLLHLYESDFDPEWLAWAQALQAKQDVHFWDTKAGGYFFSKADSQHLLVRNKEFHDGATPSANGVSALNLQRLFALTFDRAYQKRNQELFAAMSGLVNRYPAGFAQALLALDYHLDRSKEIAIVGDPEDPKLHEMRQYLFEHFLPNKVVAIGRTGDVPLLKQRVKLGDATTFYVCEGMTCKAPTNDIKQAQRLIADFARYQL